ncbi:MAG: cell wall hydrolase [Lachnospiraceae bacterium]|nr:cell wall hydrolase [Lachnospiraceae bacterium]
MKAAGRRRRKGILAMLLCIGLISPSVVYATTTQEQLNQAQEEHRETQSQLEETEEELEGLKEAKNSLQGQLNTLNDQLSAVSANLEDLEAQIEDKEEEIRITEEELVTAKETETMQYESMKRRIKYMYERNDHVVMEALFGAGNLGEFLNMSEYVEQVSEYDRTKLEEYEQTRRSIEEKEARLNREKEELDALKEEVEAEKKKVTGYVNQTAAGISAYSGQISEAEQQALEYEARIREQEENITYLKKKLAEEQAMSKLAAQSSWRDISEITFEEGDRYLLANLIYCEAGGEPPAGQLAVGAVVINRVLSSVYPDTVVGVIYQKSQFSPAGSGRLALALAENRATASCYEAADAAMAGQTNVGSCVYFRTPIPGLTGISIGNHIFY